MKTLALLIIILFGQTLIAQETKTMTKKVEKTESEWKQILSPQEYLYCVKKVQTGLETMVIPNILKKAPIIVRPVTRNFLSQVLNMNLTAGGLLLTMPLKDQ